MSPVEMLQRRLACCVEELLARAEDIAFEALSWCPLSNTTTLRVLSTMANPFETFWEPEAIRRWRHHVHDGLTRCRSPLMIPAPMGRNLLITHYKLGKEG